MSRPLPSDTTAYIGKDGKPLKDFYKWLQLVAEFVTTGSLSGPYPRTKLLANATFYVRTDGNDSNNGSANNAANAFATPQGAYNYLLANVDLAGFTATVSIQDGTYTGTLTVGAALVGQGPASGLTFTGGAGVTLANPSETTVSCNHSGARCRITGGMTITSAGRCLSVADNAYLEIGNINFGAADVHINSGPNGHCFMFSNYSVSGGAAYHIVATGNGTIEFSGKTVTITGTPTFAQAFVLAIDGGIIQSSGMTYSGAVIGSRYDVKLGGVIETNSSGPNYFPGNIAGTANAPSFGFYG